MKTASDVAPHQGDTSPLLARRPATARGHGPTPPQSRK
jgi:hypothetical protein